VFGLSLFNFFAIYSLINTNRRNEFGVKKILGASIVDFIKVFFLESVFVCIVVFGISILLFTVLYPYFTQIISNDFSFSLKNDGLVFVLFFTVILLAMVLWSVIFSRKISPLRIRKNYSNRKETLAPYKVVTVLQYSITITLLIVTISFFRQFNFMQNQDLNFSCENVISVNMFPELPYYSFKSGEEDKKAHQKQANQISFVEDELTSSSLIESYTLGSSPFNMHQMGWKKKGEENYKDGGLLTCYTDFENVFDLELVQGRFFDKNIDKERGRKAIVNEAALRYFNIEDIETDGLCHSSFGRGKPFEIVGVVKDFKNEHLSRPTSPVVMLFWHDVDREWFIRINGKRRAEAIAFVQELYKKVAPNETFKYKFVENELEAIYVNDRMQVRLYSILTVLALFISLMGILALSLHHAYQRTKETGIRKVNGCTTIQATNEMLIPHAILVCIAFLISCGAGWYFVNEYLKNFAHKLPISYLLFGIAGGIAVLISIITLFISLYQIASKNPIETIQTEQ
jgi:putative ABC transport system permease protein